MVVILLTAKGKKRCQKTQKRRRMDDGGEHVYKN
jgi:hypothetical protein